MARDESQASHKNFANAVLQHVVIVVADHASLGVPSCSIGTQLHEAEDHFSYSELRADAPRVVISRSAEAGDVVKAGQTIVTVAQDGGTDAVFDVPATLMRQISPDVVVTVSLTDDPRSLPPTCGFGWILSFVLGLA
jgi:HlyD family secretion protein